MDLGGQQSAFDTAITPGARGLGRFQGRRLELWGWIVSHLAGAKVGIPHFVAAISYIDCGEVLSICQHAQRSSGLELSWGRSLIWTLSHNPFIGQTQVCPLPYHPQSWGGGRRWAGLVLCSTHRALGGSPEHKPLSSSPHSFLLVCWMKLNWFAQTKAAIRGVSDYTQAHISKTSKKKKKNLMNIISGTRNFESSRCWKLKIK